MQVSGGVGSEPKVQEIHAGNSLSLQGAADPEEFGKPERANVAEWAFLSCSSLGVVTALSDHSPRSENGAVAASP
jgi:hypothetical protein